MADFKGEDHQIDTYFNVPAGRLKLRRGTVENTLIFYQRPNQTGPKHSAVELERLAPDNQLRPVLAAALGVLVEVEKFREIYFLKNVKIHLDRVPRLGTFVEIEAIDRSGTRSLSELRTQCDHYVAAFNIQASDLIDWSYSDMLLEIG